jgi:hypothetical protein
VVDGRAGASEDAQQPDIGIARDDRKQDFGDGRSGLSAATGAEDARSAGVAPIGGVTRRDLPTAVRAEKAVRRHKRGEADENERRQNARHPLTFPVSIQEFGFGSPCRVGRLRRFSRSLQGGPLGILCNV